jgi:membrane protein DedA with SNARE-associated domain
VAASFRFIIGSRLTRQAQGAGLEHWVADATAFIAAQERWAGPAVFALAFAESLAFLSLFVPFTAMIVAAGTLIGTGKLDPWLILPWGILGACLGDAISYWIGRYFGRSVPRLWPFRKDPDLIDCGHRFFLRWGVLSVCLGRFFGPLRAVVPLVAGMMAMPQRRFQIANVASALVWLPLLLAPGALAGSVFKDVPQFGERSFLYVFVAFLVFPLVVGLFAWLRKRRRA